MINKTDYYNWQKPKKTDYVKFRSASPNLVALKDYLIKRWGGTNVGILSKRPIHGGSAPSTHTFGAALDWRYGSMDRVVMEREVFPFLIENSLELGVQMIADYLKCRIWTPSKGWHKVPPNRYGMGAAWGTWLHIETNKTQWKNNTPVSNRL